MAARLKPCPTRSRLPLQQIGKCPRLSFMPWGANAFSAQRTESFRHILLHGAPGSRRFLTLTWVSRYRRGSQVTAQKSGGNLGHRAIQASYWNVPSVPNLRLRIKSQIQRLPRPCPCVLCRDKAGNLTWHPQLMEIKIPALSQKTRQERGTLED